MGEFELVLLIICVTLFAMFIGPIASLIAGMTRKDQPEKLKDDGDGR